MAKANDLTSGYTLPFEQPVIELEKQISVLEQRDPDEYAEENLLQPDGHGSSATADTQ